MAQTTDHKESTATVRIVYRKYDMLKDGSHPFFICITKNRQRKYIATGLSLHPQYWNDEKGTFRKNLPTAQRKTLEAAFRVWEEKYTNAAQTLAGADEVHDARSVATKVSSERLTGRKYKLLEYIDVLVSQFEKTGNVGNRKVYRDVQNNLRRFVGEGQDVAFDGVTVKFCNEWENKMRSEGLTEITLSVKFRTLRAVLNKAIANGYAKPTSYPFARNTAETNKFQIGKFDTKTTKRAISKTDIRKIEAYQPTARYTADDFKGIRNPNAAAKIKNAAEIKRQTLAKDLFMFSYYCGGINFVDMAALRWKNIGKDLDDKPRLTYTRQKTGGKFSLCLMPVALAILERYKPDEVYPNSYVFPILNTALHKTPSQIHNRCSKVMGYVNQDLKIIGAAVGIQTPLTTYVARHSFATALKRSGVATAVIGEIFQHPDGRTTQIYLAEFETDLVDAAFENL